MAEPPPSVQVTRTKSISLRRAHSKIEGFIREHQIHDDYLNIQSLRDVEVKVSEEVLEKLNQVKFAMEEEMGLDSGTKSEQKKRKNQDGEEDTSKKKRKKHSQS